MKEKTINMMFSLLGTTDVFFIIFVMFCFILLLNYYGYALIPIFHDEIYFLQPAQNLAEGKGMGTPALDELLPGISQRTYWQPPVYFLTLAMWGKLVGFDIMLARWMSRLFGVGVLLLLYLLALKWGVHPRLALICMIWTALDLSFQYNSNIARMDTFNAFLTITCLLIFTSYQQNRKSWQAFASGLFGALATLTHFIAIPPIFILFLALIWRKNRRDLSWFLLPITFGWAMWLIYAAQDWSSFWTQLHSQFVRKGEIGFLGKLIQLLFPQSVLPFFGVFSVNSPPIWFSLLLASILGWKRKFLPLSGWQFAFILSIYCSAALGGELWYVGWFTPFGYLLLSLWLQQAFQENRWRFILVGLCLLWIGYQSIKVGQALSSVRSLKTNIDRFNTELASLLPPNSQILIYGLPDPVLNLLQLRPDLRIIILSPTPMQQEAFKRILQSSDFFVGISEWGQRRGLPLSTPKQEWSFSTPLGSWSVGLFPLKEANSDY